MIEILHSNPAEVNTHSKGTTQIQYPKKDRVHRYTRRKLSDIRETLIRTSPEKCLEIVRSIKDIKMFPGTMLTNRLELIDYFEAYFDAKLVNKVKKKAQDGLSPHAIPVIRGTDLIARIKESAPDTKQYTSGRYVYFECGNGEAIRGTRTPNTYFIQTFSPYGIILVAYYLVNGHSEDNRRIAKLLVDKCEKSGIFDPPKPKSEPTEPLAVIDGESKINPAETLTQMFNAVLTLLVKESEEHGAEKVIAKLKEEGIL